MKRKDVVRTSGLLDKYLFVRPYETLSVCSDLGVLIQDFQDILCRASVKKFVLFVHKSVGDPDHEIHIPKCARMTLKACKRPHKHLLSS